MSEVDLLEHLSLRDLPPVERIEPPHRFSQTLLKHYERCHRAAWLYTKYRGGMPSSALDRGAAFHLFAARATAVMIAQNEPRIPPELAKTLLEEVLDEHPELTIPLADIDDLREMSFHFAQGVTINPQHVVAVERKFVLPVGDYMLSGIIDRAEINEQAATVRDWKTQFMPPSHGEYEGSFQGRFYAALLCFGQPVNDDGTLDPCLGDRLTWVDVGEAYPRHLDADGTMLCRHYGMSRLAVHEIRTDLARMAEHLAASFASGEFPATSGSHCSECPMEPACPLPRELRAYAGAINTLEEAQEASVWFERWQARLNSTRKEIKLWARQHGGFRYGRDREWVFDVSTTNITDWDGLAEAIERTRQYGVPFDQAEHRRQRTGTKFVARTVGREDDDQDDE